MKHRDCAFAMIEVVMATAITAGLTVGALTLVASTSAQKTNAALVAKGQMLCRTLAEEISTRPVADWSSGAIDIDIDVGILKVTGIDAKGVTVTVGKGNRTTFETVDAYSGYTEKPPKDENGNTMTGYTGWARTVTIAPAVYADPNSTSATETGMRRITVTAYFGDKVIASSTFLRSSEWERVQP